MKIFVSVLMMALSIHSFAGTRANIIDIAKEAGNFKTLLTALKVTGLEQVVKDSKRITVFAPTDEAFAKLPDGALASLLADKEALSDILLYHVSAKKIKAKKIVEAREVKTLQGQTILVDVNDQGVFLNEAKVIKTDIKASNGIIHVIDSVLIFDETKPANTLETEQDIDLKKYLGLWYEYARYDNKFQKECLGTTAEYKLKRTPITKRKYVRVINTCQKEDGTIQQGKARAFVANKETNATLKVSFVPVLNYFGLFPGDYNILKVGPDYEYALVGDKARANFWILTRTKTIPDALYQELLDIAVEKGFRKELIKKRPVFTK